MKSDDEQLIRGYSHVELVSEFNGTGNSITNSVKHANHITYDKEGDYEQESSICAASDIVELKKSIQICRKN